MSIAPDLMDAFQTGMADLGDALELLDRHGPAYLELCLERGAVGRSAKASRELPVPLARVIRQLADDALERTAPGRPQRTTL